MLGESLLVGGGVKATKLVGALREVGVAIHLSYESQVSRAMAPFVCYGATARFSAP